MVVPQRGRAASASTNCVDVDDQKTLSTGVRASEYYLCSKETKKSCVIDPAPYKVRRQDRHARLLYRTDHAQTVRSRASSALTCPVNFIQEMLLGANQKLYSGAGEMALIGGNGRIVAYTKDSTKFGEKVSDILDSKQIANMANLKRGEVTYTVDKNQGRIELYLPFGIGQTDARWTPDAATAAGRGDGRICKSFRLTSTPNANPTPSAWPWSAC